MVAQRITEPLEIHIDPESETGKVLAEARAQAEGRPLLFVVEGGARYRVEAEEHVEAESPESVEPMVVDRGDPFANYDPERALAAWQGTFGILKGLDIETFKAEMRDARGQEREGRPVQ